MKTLFYIGFSLLLASCVDGNKPTSANQSPASTNTQPTGQSPTSNPAVGSTNSASSGSAQISQPLQSEPKATSNAPLYSEPVPIELENEIKRVMEVFGKQEIKLGGNEIPIEAAKASKLLIGAYMKSKSKVHNWEDFVNVLSSEPTTSGKPFYVLDKERKQTPLGEYLNQLHKKK